MALTNIIRILCIYVFDPPHSNFKKNREKQILVHQPAVGFSILEFITDTGPVFWKKVAFSLSLAPLSLSYSRFKKPNPWFRENIRKSMIDRLQQT